MSRDHVPSALIVIGIVGLLSGDLSAQEAIWRGGCGDGVIDRGEECDPGIEGLFDANLGGATCEGLGFTGGGELACTSKCRLDLAGCFCAPAATLPATGQTSCWDPSGSPIECTETGHDGDLRAGGALSYVVHGDGTITDQNTGLMWERKDDAGGIHDKDVRYTWEASFTEFIDTLNDTCGGDGLVVCDSDAVCGAEGRCGFAGHRDWRMPNVRELQSIVYYGHRIPSVHPAFHDGCSDSCTDCSCTVNAAYWSSTTGSPRVAAWYVSFFYGYVSDQSKFYPAFVRAVRGGSVPAEFEDRQSSSGAEASLP